MNPIALGGVIEAVGKIADDLITTDKERLAAELEQRRLGIEELRITADVAKGQLEVNRAEAGHSSVFVAGWRPAVGWVGALALAWQGIAHPILVWAWALAQAQGYLNRGFAPPPVLETEALVTLVSAMLGIATMRTVEKARSVSRAEPSPLQTRSAREAWEAGG